MKDAEIKTDPFMHDARALERFVPRSTDVFVNTAPKAGTTWTQNILHQLRSGGDSDFASIYDVVPWLEFKGWAKRNTIEDYECLNNPRVFKSHLRYDYTPGTSVAKFVVVGRDPRDCCVSAYHHMSGMTAEMMKWLSATPPQSFDAYVEQWLESGWYEHVAGWWEQRAKPNILWIRYADMKTDMSGTIDSLVEFLGWNVSSEVKAKTIELSSFAWMSNNRDKFTRFSAMDSPGWKPRAFIRKGAVGDHQSMLSSTQERKVVAEAQKQLDGECLAYLGLNH